MKYDPTLVAHMRRPTATYTWAVVGGELAEPPIIACMAISADDSDPGNLGQVRATAPVTINGGMGIRS